MVECGTLYNCVCVVIQASVVAWLSQERAFLGVSTLKELVLKRPQGPESTENFLHALLEVTMGDIELASVHVHVWHTHG